MNEAARGLPSSCSWATPSEGQQRLHPPRACVSRMTGIRLMASESLGLLFTSATDVATSSAQVSQSQRHCLLLTFSSWTLPMLWRETPTETCSIITHVQSGSVGELIPSGACLER